MAQFSQRQIDARMRNHRIFRLRGLWWNLGLLDPDLAEAAQNCIDLQLVRLGAESERVRNDASKAELEEWMRS